MFGSGRLAASWELVKQSWGVLRSEKQLVVFPIISGIACVLVTVVFLAPMLLAGVVDAAFAGQRNARILSGVVAFAFYVVQYFVIFFANTALVGAVLRKLSGQSATVGDGFRIAASRVGVIFGYALIVATVGMILRWLRDQARQSNNPLALIGLIAVGLLGAAWNIATFLVVPVLAVEGVGPIAAIKRSTALLKRTWGEQIIGNFGIGLVFGLLTFVTMLLGAGLIVGAAATRLAALIVVAVALVIVALLALAVVGNTLSGIYRAAIYRYAATGQISSGFEPHLVQRAFSARQPTLPRASGGFGGSPFGGNWG